MRPRPAPGTLLVAVSLALLLVPGCGGGDGGPESAAADSTAATSAPAAEPRDGPRALAPELGATTLAGDSVTLAGLRGEVVLLNVWATWCGPCRREIPVLQALHEEYDDRGLRVVGVTVDGRQVEDAIRAFIDEYGITYDIWWDPDQSVLPALEAVGVPVTVLIGRDGRVRWRHTGVIAPEDPELLAALEDALA